ncbi:ligand-binding SRPBCC domain-containing protein [Pontibacter mucosus]|uniref:Ligand-binding SRPBCC domain-containing protein n=1 Tax=Pontibacter mucosus TaxID=1649266 RepID=A0A2T5YGT4_9BACT|nr:SRPBCC family protein [Pontibacter mucosus]PTX18513.1 ligand-binding SRPBCC domain-containing protein [Pontibacter mucosus]
MPTISFETTIHAPVEVCFDLSRSIDLHVLSTKHTGEQAIAGVTSGLISLGESVTWRARHFGLWQHLTSRITEFERPYYFADEMVAGAFKRFKHEHHFQNFGKGITLMRDVFVYTSPFGTIGKVADTLFLKKYMTSLLWERNNVIKHYAESGQWESLLHIDK